MFVAAQYLFLKSSLFKNLMRAYSPCISEISLSAKRMRAVDQKHNYQLEWPNLAHMTYSFCVYILFYDTLFLYQLHHMFQRGFSPMSSRNGVNTSDSL